MQAPKQNKIVSGRAADRNISKSLWKWQQSKQGARAGEKADKVFMTSANVAEAFSKTERKTRGMSKGRRKPACLRREGRLTFLSRSGRRSSTQVRESGHVNKDANGRRLCLAGKDHAGLAGALKKTTLIKTRRRELKPGCLNSS